VIREALRTAAAAVIASAAIAYLAVAAVRRDLKPDNVIQRRPRTGPLR